MTDITKCEDKECNLRNKCYRYTAKSNPYYQSYFTNKVKINKDICDYFIGNSRYENN